MITIYGCWPTRAFRVAWALEELGLEYRSHPVDLRVREKDEAFLQVNPAGFVPAIEDDGVVMVDSIAILQYLIARYGDGRLAPAADSPSFPKYQQFLHLGESGLAAYLNIVVATKFFAPEAEKQNWGENVARRLFASRLTLVSRQLASTAHIAGADFTAADISVAYALDMADRLGVAGPYGAEIVEYRDRMSSRPAYKAAIANASPPVA